MKKIIGYENHEYGIKTPIFKEVDLETSESKAAKAEHRKKIAEKYGIK